MAGDMVEPFVVDIPQSELDDLRERLSRTRWPDRETVDGTAQGPPLAKVQALCEYWSSGYDWRRAETLLNDWGQYRTTIDGLGIHFLHVRSPEPDALPLLLTHGWPGSVFEFRHLIGPLTDPVAYGGDTGDAFHLVIPSLPGFGFSDKPTTTGWGVAHIASAWIELMRRLGYETWAAQGGDWGSAVTEALGRMSPAGLVATHSNLPLAFPTPEEVAEATPEEREMIAGLAGSEEFTGYSKQQSTRPQSLGYALADSPAGQAAWIYYTFQDFSDTGGDPESVFGLDGMLDDITLYWLTNTATSSARLYWEGAREQASQPAPDGPNPTPAGFSVFPREAIRASRRWLERRYANVLYYAQHEHGGHFAALEQPQALVDDVRATFRTVRSPARRSHATPKASAFGEETEHG
jgi:pimeloyl-ACP methyl ester carboxylesterase